MHDFVPLTVVAVRRETADAVAVSLAVPEAARSAFAYRPGQHLGFRATLGGEEMRRTYSICSGPEDPHLSVAIKRIPGGAFSNWACTTLAPGMTLDCMPPAGRFVLPEQAGARGHILAFAAGAGITPIIAMTEHALRGSGIRVTLVYGNREPSSIIFRERLEDLKDAFVDRFTLVHILSRSGEDDVPLLQGRITAEKVAALSRHFFQPADVDDVFLCGPGTMIRDVRAALFGLGFARERVHHEFFAAGGGAYRTPAAGGVGARPGAVAGAAPAHETAHGAAAEVVAILDGRRHRFGARPGETVVEAALRAGVKAPYSCKGGMCSTCRARVVDGAATMRVNYSLEPWETEKGFVLTCQAIPATAHLTVDYDQM